MSHTSERVGIGCTPPESAYSTSTGSSSSTSSVRSAYPKKGKTRIPSKLVSRQAILDLGYPFFEEGNTIIIQQALGQDNIDELLKASENYKKAELETHEARNPARDTVRKIPLDTDKDGSGTMGNDIPFPPLSNNLRDDQNVPSGTSGSMMRPWINQVLTSGFLRLSNNRKQEEIQSTNPVASDVHQAWVSPQAILEDGTLSSNLFNIHAAEYYQGEIGTHRTTLLCPDRPYISGEGASSVKMRWLHLNGIPSKLRTFENLVTDCPYVSQKLKSVALNVLLEVEQQCYMLSDSSPEIVSGTVVRYVGKKYDNPSRFSSESLHSQGALPTSQSLFDTEPVVFLSTPSLALPQILSGNHSKQSCQARTLLEFLYGYDSTGVQQAPSSASRQESLRDDTSRCLHVPETWFLLIGSDILMSFSELSWQEMISTNITIDRQNVGSAPGVYVVQVVDKARTFDYHIVVERNCNYGDFMKELSRMAQHDEVNSVLYSLSDEHGRLIDHQVWVDYVVSGEIENHTFELKVENAEFSNEDAKTPPNPTNEPIPNVSEGVDGPNLGHQFQTPEPASISDQGDDVEVIYVDVEPPKRSSSFVNDEQPGTQYHATPNRRWKKHPKLLVPLPMPLIDSIKRQSIASIPKPHEFDQNPNLDKAEALSGSGGIDIAQRPQSNTVPIDARVAPINFTSTSMLPMAAAESSTVAQQKPSINLVDNSSQHSSLPAHDSQPSSQSSQLLLSQLPNREDNTDLPDSSRASLEANADINLDYQIGHKDWGLKTSCYFGSGSSSPATDILGNEIIPFLTWRLSWDTSDESYIKQERALARLLNKMDVSLLESPFGRFYSNVFCCGWKDVERRCQVLGAMAHDRPPTSALQKVGKAESRLDYRELSLVAHGSKVELIHALLKISESIFHGFLPRTDTASAHPISKRFWGTLDSILRQIHLSSITSQHLKGPATVTISRLLIHTRNGTFNTPSEMPFHACNYCDKHTVYTSIHDAVRHIHQSHIQCACSLEGSKVVDDPCLGWIQWHGPTHEPDASIMSVATALVDTLTDVRNKTRNIHASVGGRPVNSSQADDRPHLLPNLVFSFENIIGKYVLAAKELSWTNRQRLQSLEVDLGTSTLTSISMIRSQSKDIHKKLQEHLDLAKRDILTLGTGRGDIDRLIISPIGPEFLLATLVNNLQNNAILQGIGKTTDIIKYYRTVSARLRFGAVRGPRRRRFLEISALEEELDALRAVLEVQGRLVKACRTILDPAYFNAANTDWDYFNNRKAMYPLEKKLLDVQVNKLAEDSKTLEVLQRIAQVTRHDMKQIIEVLEEGHGKAIRVFTFVTLFFLPLSFVTSFFGMNTTEIRDTNWDQRIFWSSAIPLTALVLALALLYGYKWDEVIGLFNTTFNSQRSTGHHDILEQDLTPLAEDASTRNSKVSHVHPIPTHRAPWIGGLARVKRRRQSRNNEKDVARRQTFDSFIA